MVQASRSGLHYFKTAFLKQPLPHTVPNSMENISQNEVDWLLNLHKKGQKKKRVQKGHSELKKTFLWSLIIFFGIIGLILLPFYLLVRTSVYLNLTYGYSGWMALGGGMAVSILLLLIYLLFLFQKVKNKKRRLQFSLGSAGVMVFGFCLFSLFYLSGVNAKTDNVRDVYRSMHPILRVAISTVTLADSDLVITDIERVLSDYGAMGLPVNPNSLHYRQEETGYVHAIDLRTRGRSEIRNFLLQTSLEIMGFRTLRHVGTADHLHVELAVR